MRILKFHSGVVFVLLLNLMYPIFYLYIKYFKMYDIEVPQETIVYIFISSFSVIFVSIIPPLKLYSLPASSMHRINYYWIFISAAIILMIFPWYEVRSTIYGSIANVFRALWVLYVWSRLPHAKTHEALILGVSSVVLAFLDGSRTYLMLALIPIFPILFPSITKKVLALLLIPTLISLVHAFRTFHSEPSWDPNLFHMLIEGFIGESLWGMYGVSQVAATGNNVFVLDTLQTFLLPIFGFLKYVCRFGIECNGFLFDPNFFQRVNVVAVSQEKYFPMAGYLIHVQFLPYGTLLGCLLLFLYLYLIRQLSCFVLGARTPHVHWAILFIAVKASPEVIVNLIYYIGFLNLLLVLIGRFSLKKVHVL